MRSHSTKFTAVTALALLVSLLPMGAASAAAPRVSVSDVSLVEGAPGTTKVAKFKVTLSRNAPKKVTVDFETVNGKAKAGTDFVAKSGTLTFRPGTDKKVVKVKVKGEDLYELNEAFFLRLSNASRARIDDAKGKGTINNDDDPPSLTADIESVVEGGIAMITFELSEESGVPATFSYDTFDDSATAGVDYEPISGEATIPAGQTQKQNVGVQTLGDQEVEADEIFGIQLSETSPHVSLVELQDFALGQILDNDSPTMSIEDVTVTETNTSQNVEIDVTLSEAHPSKDITFSYATAPDSATAPADYVQESGPLTIDAGETTETIELTVNGDILDEGEGTDPVGGQSFEEFFVNLNAPQNATIADGQGKVTITDDDPMPTLSVTDVTVLEGTNPGTCFVQANFGFNLSAPSGRVVSVNFATANNTATTSPPPQDYLGVGGFHNFFPGQTGKSQTVQVCSDNVDEPNETFFVNLHTPTNATLSDSQGVGTINDDD